MKEIIKTDIQSYNDGTVDIYLTDDTGKLSIKKESFRFQNRVVGSKRFYEAAAVKIKINMLIRIHMAKWLDDGYKAVINGSVYNIVQVQHIHDAHPKSTDISLTATKLKISG